MSTSCINFCKKKLAEWPANASLLRFQCSRTSMYAARWFSQAAIFASFFQFFCSTSFVLAADLPSELTFNNAPIDALCFEQVSADEWLDVAHCTKDHITKLPPDPADGWAADAIGYRYRYAEDRSDAMSYSYYRNIGQWHGVPVVVSYSNGGGSGAFSSLLSMERNAGKIRVLRGFGAGDRCNGGIVDPKIEAGTLYYGQNMTPIDFLQLAEDNPNDLQPYDDLEASAASCFGVARFEDEAFVGVSLVELPKTDGMPASYKYQACFNGLYTQLLAGGKKELSVAELKEFTARFNQECVKADDVNP